jgi:hypothetical protein
MGWNRLVPSASNIGGAWTSKSNYCLHKLAIRISFVLEVLLATQMAGYSCEDVAQCVTLNPVEMLS